jgi:tryptophan-rich sensory protein
MHMQTTRRQIIGLGGWLLLSFIVSAIGAAASVQAKSFYGQLAQPAWAPPGWVFGPVWTVLYVLMAVAAWLVWRSGGFRQNRLALSFFLVQLVFNALWSWLFFGWRLGGWAFADILALLVSLAITLVLFWRVRRAAGVLLIPYLAWVTFAAVLNFVVWQMNPQVLG